MGHYDVQYNPDGTNWMDWLMDSQQTDVVCRGADGWTVTFGMHPNQIILFWIEVLECQQVSTSDDVWIIALGVVVFTVGMITAFAVLWYMVKYNIALSTFVKTRDVDTWRKTKGKLARKTAILVGILSLIGFESCVLMIFSDWPDRLRSQMMPMAFFAGIGFALFAAGTILLQAWWTEIIYKK